MRETGVEVPNERAERIKKQKKPMKRKGVGLSAMAMKRLNRNSMER